MNYAEKLTAYKSQIEMMSNTLFSHQWIVKVGAYTIGLDEENKTVLENVNFPSQFTKEGVEEIKTGCKFSGKDGQPVQPQVVFVKDWYNEQIEALEMIVSAGIK